MLQIYCSNLHMEEISLKELIKDLLKEKMLIITITIVCIILGLAFALTRGKVYEATLTLLTNPISQNTTIDTKNLNTIVDSVSNPFTTMDIMTYKEQFLSPSIVLKTIEELDLKDDEGIPLKVKQIRDIVDVSNPEKTNLLVIKVKNSNPELAADIANSLGRNFVEFISQKNKDSAKIVADSLMDNLIVESKKLDEEAVKLKDYLSSSKNIDSLSSEISSTISQLTSYKSSLNDVQKRIVVFQNSLSVILSGSNTTSNIALNDVSIGLAGSASGDYTISADNSSQLKSAMLTIEVTNLETSLISSIEEEKMLKLKIEDLEKNLSELQSILAAEQYKYDSIQRDYSLAEQTYGAYQVKYKEALVASVYDIGKISIQVSSEAVIPFYPVGTSKSIIVAISAVLGIMLGMFTALFKNYWTNTDTSSKVLGI